MAERLPVPDGIPDGVVDLYVHAEPDVIPRVGDDLMLAAGVLAGGFRAAVHRNHHSVTAERCSLVAAVTGAPLHGAVLTNRWVGGIDPAVVEVALRHGARWVGLPTLSARHFRGSRDPARTGGGAVLQFGGEGLALTDPDGAVLPAVRDVLDLAAAAGAPVNLGYASAPECRAAGRAAREQGVRATVVTNPISVIGLSPAEALSLLDDTGAWLEVTAYSMHPSHVAGADRHVRGLLELLRAAGPRRCVLSSDSGIAGAPSAVELLGHAGRVLRATGFTDAEVAALLCHNPAEVLGL